MVCHVRLAWFAKNHTQCTDTGAGRSPQRNLPRAGMACLANMKCKGHGEEEGRRYVDSTRVHQVVEEGGR